MGEVVPVLSSIEVDSNETRVFNLSQKNYRQDVFYNFNTNVCISDMQNIRKRVLICLQYYIYYMFIFFVNNHSCISFLSCTVSSRERKI